MAYLIKTNTQCDVNYCTKRDAVRLFDRVNTNLGKYCRACGGAKLKDLQNHEDESGRQAKGEA